MKVLDIDKETEGFTPPSYSTTESLIGQFEMLTGKELQSLLLSSLLKTSALNSIPIFLLREFADALLPFLVRRLHNSSLAEGCLPAEHKRTIVHPSLEKPGLNHENIANIRPISNLTFLLKLIEEVVAQQMVRYL